MNKKTILILSFVTLLLLSAIGYQIYKSVKTPVNNLPEPVFTPLPASSDSVPPQSIATKSGTFYSATDLINNNKTKVAAEDLFQNTTVANVYDIFYYEIDGIVTILLYDEDLATARSTAETQLLTILTYTKEQICEMDIAVLTNEFVSQQYAGINLGLSFCPGSVQL